MSEPMNLNGNGRTSTHPLDVYSETRQRQRQHGELTDLKLESLQATLDALKAERQQNMHAASDHAGAIGMVYRADLNEYVRMVSGQTRPMTPNRPKRPDPPLAAPAPPPKSASEPRQGVGHYLAESVHWLLAVPVGMFVGYGLGTLTGLPIQRQPALLVMAIVIGVCAVFGTKVFLGKLWHTLGLQKVRGEITPWNFWAGILVSLAVCGVEASLGAMALVIYSSRVAFEDSQRLNYAVALPMAVAISTCVLLVSAVNGYLHGQLSLSNNDDQDRMFRHQQEEHRKQLDSADGQHRQEVEEWETRVARMEADHAAEVQRFSDEKAEFEGTKNGADYQALLKYIGRISVLNESIAEAQSRFDDYAASRGHGKAVVL